MMLISKNYGIISIANVNILSLFIGIHIVAHKTCYLVNIFGFQCNALAFISFIIP